LKEISYQVIVVDDAPTDGVVDALCREFLEVKVIANPSPDGPARAYNAGLRHLGFPAYILVMHDSAEVSAGTLARMVGYLKDHLSTAGVVASRIDPGHAVHSQSVAIIEPASRRPQRPRRVRIVSTTCALVRGEVFFDVGLYDERLRACHEALEWSLRARRKGYSFTFLPEARVIHHPSSVSPQNRSADLANRLVDTLWVVYKHAGRRWATVFYGVLRLLSKWFEFWWRGDRDALRQIDDVRMQTLYGRIRAENQLPLQLSRESANRDVT
jgi:GT2 family glycosyltransferase